MSCCVHGMSKCVPQSGSCSVSCSVHGMSSQLHATSVMCAALQHTAHVDCAQSGLDQFAPGYAVWVLQMSAMSQPVYS